MIKPLFLPDFTHILRDMISFANLRIWNSWIGVFYAASYCAPPDYSFEGIGKSNIFQVKRVDVVYVILDIDVVFPCTLLMTDF